jgi:hypothetical protein
MHLAKLTEVILKELSKTSRIAKFTLAVASLLVEEVLSYNRFCKSSHFEAETGLSTTAPQLDNPERRAARIG